MNILKNLFKFYVSRKKIEDAVSLDLSLFQIQDYNLIIQNCNASAHGGLAYYIYKNWGYTIRICDNKSPDWKEMFVTLADPLKQNKTNLVLDYIYIHPHTQVIQLISFIDNFNTTVAQFEAWNNTIFVCDYNINLQEIN